MSDLNEPTFQDELEALINKHSLERHSNTPDFVLAEYMADCLHIFNRAVFARTKFHAPVDEAVEQSVQRIGGGPHANWCAWHVGDICDCGGWQPANR